MKRVLLASAALLAIWLVGQTQAKADLVLVSCGASGCTPTSSVAASFTDIGADGFGHDPRLLTMQTSPIEVGSATPINVNNGDAVPNSGGNKTNTPTLSALGWGSGAQVGIGFNSDQTGQSGITMNSLVLTIFNGTTPVGTFSLASSLTPLQFSAADLALQQGNGNAVFNFGLTATEQAQFNAILAEPGSSGFFAGLASSLGCAGTPSATCQPSNDGPDSFIGFHQVPGPIVGAGVPGVIAGCLGLIGLARRRRQRFAA